MRYLRLVAILILIFLSYYYFMVYKGQNRGNQQVVVKQWQTKTDEQGSVLVKATPIDLGKNTSQWKFTVTFTTHSEELDQDPTKVISLIDDKGNVFEPLSWEGPGSGGHHREGTLIFRSINSVPKYIELRIKDVGGISERSLIWDLE